MARESANPRRWITGICGLALLSATASVNAQTLTINRADYADRLRGMWLGEVIGNWTGMEAEGVVTTAPFYTDADWNVTKALGNPFGNYANTPNPPILGYHFYGDGWRADDDTDVEYSYFKMMTDAGNNPMLTSQQIAAGWASQNSQWLFFANGVSRANLSRGVPVATAGIPAANVYSHYIDAQLTTEVFGALAPGRPDVGMKLALQPTLLTSRGHATHAAQYFQNMYSLAAVVPSNLNSAQKMEWLNTEARKYIPDSSKVADIIDFVVADFKANPDLDNWESTRNKIYTRYQQQAGANGFSYRFWTESSVNIATGVMALLYGDGDYKRTIRIATLSGWDSDNSTASLGGLYGLMYGSQYIRDQFSQSEIINRITMTPTTLTEVFLPQASGLSNVPATDNFTAMGNRMLPIIDNAVLQMGGTVDLNSNTWTIPLLSTADAQKIELSPTQKLTEQSANNKVRALGGTVTASSSAVGQAPANAANLQLIADGIENNFSGVDYAPSTRDGKWYTTAAPGNSASTEQWLAVNYSMPVWVTIVRFIEGQTQVTANGGSTTLGGSFESLRLELLVDGNWVTPPLGTTFDGTLTDNSAFQQFEFTLPYGVQASGIRVLGLPNATNFAVSAAELDAVIVPEPTLCLIAIPLMGLLRRRSR